MIHIHAAIYRKDRDDLEPPTVVNYTSKGTVQLAFKVCQKHFGRCTKTSTNSAGDPMWNFVSDLGETTLVTIQGDNVRVRHSYRTAKGGR